MMFSPPKTFGRRLPASALTSLPSLPAFFLRSSSLTAFAVSSTFFAASPMAFLSIALIAVFRAVIFAASAFSLSSAALPASLSAAPDSFTLVIYDENSPSVVHLNFGVFTVKPARMNTMTRKPPHTASQSSVFHSRDMPFGSFFAIVDPLISFRYLMTALHLTQGKTLQANGESGTLHHLLLKPAV